MAYYVKTLSILNTYIMRAWAWFGGRFFGGCLENQDFIYKLH
jgi:hypothetical protein